MRIFPLLFLGLLLDLATLWAQAEQEYVHIHRIELEGNKHTKDAIILRELTFSTGDVIALAELPAMVQRSKEFVMNTGLFNAARIEVEEPYDRAVVVIEVEEMWYIYPFPIFELVDRNFNVWWVQHNRSLQRLNFGLEFVHLNLTGNRDRLKTYLKYGYTRSYGLEYSIPYINRAQTLGLFVGALFSQYREVNYSSEGNEQQFIRDDDRFLFQRVSINGGLTYRPALRSRHVFSLGYKYNQVDRLVSQELNPDFFLNGRSQQRYFRLAYTYTYDDRDVRPYPWKGNALRLNVVKTGLGIYGHVNGLTLDGRYDHYMPFGKRWSLALQAGGKLSLIRREQPFNENRAMGYGGHQLRGYEYYVVDGLDMLYLKSSMRYHLFDFRIHFGKFMPIKEFRKMPVRMVLSGSFDAGAVNAPYSGSGNPFNRRLLMGGGLGLDIIFFFDKVFRLEYSINHLREKGLFLHFNANI